MYFDFRAKDAAGKDVQGVIDAPSLQAAEDILAQRQLIVVAITVRPRTSMLQTIQFFNRVKPKELVVFFRQLSTMSAATLPLVSALRILVKQTESARLKTIISEIADDVDGGARLSQAFGRHPEVFNDFYVNMVRSGETSGHLDDVLSYLADQREKDYDLMSRIRGAMVYPAFILSVMTVVGIAMMIFVVPRLTAVLIETGGELPFATRLLIGTSQFMSGYWWLLLVLAVGHVLIMHVVDSGVGRVDFKFVAVRWSSPFWRTWDWMLLSLALMHGVNGLRVVIMDYVRRPGLRFATNAFFYVVGFTLFVLGSVIVFTFNPANFPRT